MMKWRRRRSGSFDYVDNKGHDLLARSSSEQSIDESEPSDPFSPYEDLHLEDLYKKFRSKSHSDSSLAELENSLELYQNVNSPTSTPKKQYCRQKSNDKTRSQIILPSIDEHDELVSIADSGISCDADDESENDDSFVKKQRSYFLPLKGGDGFDFELPEEKNESSLLSCINEELYKRSNSDSNELPLKKFNDPKVYIKSIEHQKNIDIPHIPQHKQKLQRQFGVINSSTDNFGDTDEDKSEDFTLMRSPTTDNVLSDVENSNLIQNPTNDILSEIDMANRQIFHRLKLKAELDQPLYTGEKPDTLPYSLMSSLIWSGETSRHLPSSIEIYPTMPPNRYLPATPNDLISSDQQDSGNNFDFVVHLNISQYGPDEILVTLEDGKVVVNGKHFSESEYGFESCQFHRQYPIPDGIKKADIKSKISEEGILTITAKRSDIKTRNLQQARRGSRDLELLNLPARSFSTGHDERPVTPVLKSPSPRSPSSPSNLRTESDFKEMNATTYHAKIQCAGYKPEDLDVRVSDMELIVSGRQRINSGDKQVKHKEFTKTLTLPYDADPSSITSRFLQSVLHIEVSRLSRRASTGNILNTL